VRRGSPQITWDKVSFQCKLFFRAAGVNSPGRKENPDNVTPILKSFNPKNPGKKE
jgi:hypothetical protein